MVKMLEKSKNFKKSQKIFKKSCSQKCQKSRLSDPMGVCKHLGGQWGPLDAILKLFRKNIFFRFSGILAGYVGLLIFDFGPADRHKVPRSCPTHYFSSSQTSGEHPGTLVCHPQFHIRSVPVCNLKSTEHHPRCLFGASFWPPKPVFLI